jgi:hypothetical protein
MDVLELLRASRREREVYGLLDAVYRDLTRALALESGAVDPAWIAAENARAEAATEELRALAAVLGPIRLGGGAVPSEVRAVWAESATLAAEVVQANARLGELARTRRATVAAALARLGEGRRALAAYRPPSRSATPAGPLV